MFSVSIFLRKPVEIRTGHAWDYKIKHAYALINKELSDKRPQLDKKYRGKFCNAREWEELTKDELSALRGRGRK